MSFEPIKSLSWFIRKPLFINRFMHTGIYSHNCIGIFFIVNLSVAANWVHQVNSIFGKKLIWSWTISERAIIQCPDRANISKISTHFGEKHLFYISINLSGSSSTWSTEIMETCDLLGESNTSCAMDASVHMCDYEWTYIFILYSSFKLIVSAFCISIEHWVIL